MFDILNYEFMQKAFIVGALLAIIIPAIGLVIVLKRLSMMGDALAHSSLAGVAGGLLIGINPIIGAMFTSVLAAFGIEEIRKRIKKYSEMSIAIIMSTGIGLAAILSGFIKGSVNFNSFLFGSIVSISDFELYLIIGTSILVLVVVIVLYKELLYLTFDERAAILAGVPAKIINFIFTILVALTISIASRTIGTLIISSLMVVPVACSLQIARSYKMTLIYSMVFGLIFVLSGLVVSFYFNFKPGGAIALIGVLFYVIILVIKKVREKIK